MSQIDHRKAAELHADIRRPRNFRPSGSPRPIQEVVEEFVPTLGHEPPGLELEIAVPEPVIQEFVVATPDDVLVTVPDEPVVVISEPDMPTGATEIVIPVDDLADQPEIATTQTGRKRPGGVKRKTQVVEEES